ncbi:MAG: glycoside hydrolase family 11 protein [Treponema sp.]|nr:glycoside hydrolase family 11 protein [Treponema sp.]
MTNMHLLNRGTQGASVKNVFAILLVASALLLLPGCRNPLDPPGRGTVTGPGTGTETRTGTFSLTINGQGLERTIMPGSPTPFDRFGLQFTDLSGRNNCFDDTLHGTSYTIDLDAGNWRLDVTAYLPGDMTPVASGRLNFTVTPGQTVGGNVALSPIENAGYYGTFSWNIILRPYIEDSIVYARMAIWRISGGDETDWGTFYFVDEWNLGDGSTTENPGEFDDMPAGQYRVTFTLMNNHWEEAVIHEILHVYRDMESDFTQEFTLAHFPVSLRRYILSAWDSESQSWDFDTVGITVGHFSHLGIVGVNPDNFHATDRTGIIYWFNVVQSTAGTPHNLEALVDAALIRMAFPNELINAENFPDQPSVKSAIAGHVRNRSSIQFDWSQSDPGYDHPNTVAVTVGDSYSITITFDRGLSAPELGYLAMRLAYLRDHAQSGVTYHIYVPVDETLEPHWLDFHDITIVLRGLGDARTVNLAPWRTGSLFTVGSGVTLELGGNITLQGRVGNTQALVRVDGGTLIMRDGSKITGNISYGWDGGGVNVRSNGTFTMHNGTISYNVAGAGGGVNVSSNGTFAMHNGMISYNVADWNGGGVYVGGTGTFIMSGGEITGNATLNSGGGGVYVRGTFIMSGGGISGNAAASSGGGVGVGYEGVFQMSDGVIYGTDAEEVLRNIANWGGASLERCCCATAAQFGTFNNCNFTSRGDFASTNATIRVIGGELEAVTLFDLASNRDIQDMSPGQPWDHVWPYLERAGYATDVSIETAEYQGRNALRVTPYANWAGFDLRHPGFDFQPGDFIRVVGIAGADNTILLNINHGGWSPLGGFTASVSAGDRFVFQHTLTENDVNAITNADPQAIRVRGNTAGAVFTVTDLTVIRGGSDHYLPVLEGQVTIAGTPQVGEMLTATYSLDGTGGAVSLQWRRGSESIAGATGRSYVLQSADALHAITVRVTREGILGSITSAPTPVIMAPGVDLDPIDIWRAVINSAYIGSRGATLTPTPNGILVSGRGTGQHDHNNGLGFDVINLRRLYGGTPPPDIAISGTAAAAGLMQTQGLDPNVNTFFTAGGTWTVTIPGDVAVNVPDWANFSLPFLGTDPGEHFDYTVTGISIGGRSIQELLGIVGGGGGPQVLHRFDGRYGTRFANDNGLAGRVNGFDFEAWTDHRGAEGFVMYIYDDGSFSGTWNQTYNTLFRVGRRWLGQTDNPTSFPTIEEVGPISVRQSTASFTSTNGATYLTLYGWVFDSQHHQIEWYIVESWRNWVPVDNNGNARSGYMHHGSFTSNGETYDVVTGWRIGQPALTGQSVNFLQIFSVRQGSQLTGGDGARTSTINVTDHFNFWEANIGSQTYSGTTIEFCSLARLYEVSWCVEGFGGTARSSGDGRVTALCIRYGTNRVCTNPSGCDHC